MSFQRKLRLSVYCLQPQTLEIWAPPGDLLGSIRERYTFLSADFVIQNATGEVIGHIKGPPRFWCCCYNSRELLLKVFSADYRSQIGSITRTWNTDISTFTQNIYFTDPQMNVHTKVLFLGAAFLTVNSLFSSHVIKFNIFFFLKEYKYFQSSCC